MLPTAFQKYATPLGPLSPLLRLLTTCSVTPVKCLRKSPQAPLLLQILNQLALPWCLPFMFIAWVLAFFSSPSQCLWIPVDFPQMLSFALLALSGSWPVLLLWNACSALRKLLGSGALGFPCLGVNSHLKPHKVLRCIQLSVSIGPILRLWLVNSLV